MFPVCRLYFEKVLKAYFYIYVAVGKEYHTTPMRMFSNFYNQSADLARPWETLKY